MFQANRAFIAAAALAAAASGAQAQMLACNEGLKEAFKPDAETRVLLVKPFKKGEEVKLGKTRAPFPAAPADICLVKLLVGPGNKGREGARSATAGIGIEIWLPAHGSWNRIIRARGGGGFAGGFHQDIAGIGAGSFDPRDAAALAQGYVASSSDHGNPSILVNRDASFLMNEDGSPNTVLWNDFAARSMFEQGVKTKALAKAFFGVEHTRAYFDGFSTGGRQALKIAQAYPDLYDGLLVGAPAINWTRFITAELYPQVVMQQETGGPIAAARLNRAGAAATAACGGAELGFITDPLACRYDPSKDAKILCSSEMLNGKPGEGAANTCLTLAEARALNKIWYGQTSDGTVPDPASDNGMRAMPGSSKQLWWGLTRGTRLEALAGAEPFPIASAQVAMQLQNPAIAQMGPFLVNPKARAAGHWKGLGYEGLADAFARGAAMQEAMGGINTDQADLSGFNRNGRKILAYHGWADQLIPPQGTMNYFARAAAANGGDAEFAKFFRLYMIPGYAHDSRFQMTGALDPATSLPVAQEKLPLPEDAAGRDHLFLALRDWVEKGVEPARIDISSKGDAVSMPLCLYPAKAFYKGAGDIRAAANYECK